MAKISFLRAPSKYKYGYGRGTQQSVDLGITPWAPNLLDKENPERSILPAVGTGVRPANMPKWVDLPALRKGYGPSAIDLAAALRASASQPT